jgi:membrane protein
VKYDLRRTAEVSALVVKESARSFLRNNGFEISAALATYGVFSFIPLLFLFSRLQGGFAVLPQAFAAGMKGLLAHLFPPLETLASMDFFASAGRSAAWAILPLGFVLISLMSLTDSLRAAFLKTFGVEGSQPFLKTQALNAASACALILLFGVLFAGELAYSKLACALSGRGPFLFAAIDAAASIAVPTACLMICFLVFLPARPRTGRLLTSSLICALLIVSMRDLFSSFIRSSPAYGQSFGPLKDLFLMVIWVYYCFLVILFGAEILVHFWKRDALLLKGLFLRQAAPARLMEKFIRACAPGEIVFREGDPGVGMFYVLSGSVDILRCGKVLKTIGKGSYFGEMAMIVDAPRTATAAASGEGARLAAVSHENFDSILRENPEIVRQILKEMTLRLKEAEEDL